MIDLLTPPTQQKLTLDFCYQIWQMTRAYHLEVCIRLRPDSTVRIHQFRDGLFLGMIDSRLPADSALSVPLSRGLSPEKVVPAGNNCH